MAGNHDFLSVASNYRTFSFAKNVVFLKKNEIESVYFPELNTEVYGMSYWHREETSDVYDHITPKRQDAINNQNGSYTFWKIRNLFIGKIRGVLRGLKNGGGGKAGRSAASFHRAIGRSPGFAWPCSRIPGLPPAARWSGRTVWAASPSFLPHRGYTHGPLPVTGVPDGWASSGETMRSLTASAPSNASRT